jgi:hypothetical protein
MTHEDRETWEDMDDDERLEAYASVIDERDAALRELAALRAASDRVRAEEAEKRAARCFAAYGIYHKVPASADHFRDATEMAAGGSAATWQPIETAPKDGSRVVIFRANWRETVSVGHWSVTAKEWYVVNGGYPWHAPTHWAPIPPLPANAEGGAS